MYGRVGGRYKTAADVSSVSATPGGEGHQTALALGVAANLAKAVFLSEAHLASTPLTFRGRKSTLPRKTARHGQDSHAIRRMPERDTPSGGNGAGISSWGDGPCDEGSDSVRDDCRSEMRWRWDGADATDGGSSSRSTEYPQQSGNLVSYCGIGGCGGGILWRAGGRCWLRIRNIHALNPSPPQNATDALAVNGCGAGIVCAHACSLLTNRESDIDSG